MSKLARKCTSPLLDETSSINSTEKPPVDLWRLTFADFAYSLRRDCRRSEDVVDSAHFAEVA